MATAPTAALCGCCEPAAPSTPLVVENRPGLSAIAYRIGTFASFREAMLEAIAHEPALNGLTTRRSDDPAITLIELWAAVADVLTFYQERIANEAFLRTARERDSVLRLARLLDYHLRPGLAASALVAFSCDDGAQLTIPVGLRLMSTPGQDQLPQFYETVESIVALASLNRVSIYPTPTPDTPLDPGRTSAWVLSDEAGQAAIAGLAPNDSVVIFDTNRTDAPEEKTLKAIDAAGDRFRLNWTLPVAGTSWRFNPAVVRKLQRKMRLFGFNAPAQYPYFIQGADAQTPPTILYATTPFGVASADTLRLDATYDDLVVGDTLLVHEQGVAPQLVTVSALSRGEEILGDMPPAASALSPSSAVPTSEIPLPLADNRYRATVTSTTVTSVNAAGATVPASLSFADLRDVTVYLLKSGDIPLWPWTFAANLTDSPLYVPALPRDNLDPNGKTGNTFEINRSITGLTVNPGALLRLDELDTGRNLLLEDEDGANLAVTLANPPTPTTQGGQTYLKLDIAHDPSVALDLDTGKAFLLGNVALATHGQTIPGESLGDGDGTVPFQQFTLKQAPLTYLASAKSAQGESALTVLVSGVRWQEVSSLYGQMPRDRVFTALQTDAGSTVLQFGDGETGARLPTGSGNVVATYRQGSGLAGRVDAGQLNILLDRPVGLKEAHNPVRSDGGADPEPLSQARQNAPTTVLTFGRAISLQDFETLALVSGEVARARATWVWSGLEKAVHLTVIGQEGQSFSDTALKQIYSGLTAQRDPNHVLMLDNLCRVPIVVTALIQVDDDYVRRDVVNAARAALTDYFAFANRGIAQPVHLSDLYRALQAVAGVVYADVTTLHFKGYAAWSAAQLAARGATAAALQPHLRLFPARVRPGPGAVIDPLVAACISANPARRVLPAEQAYIETPDQDLNLTGQGGLE